MRIKSSHLNFTLKTNLKNMVLKFKQKQNKTGNIKIFFHVACNFSFLSKLNHS